MLALALLGLLLAVIGLLFFGQHGLIYHPQPYGAARVERFGRRLEALAFRTDQGRQTAFYLPPRDASRALPEALWVLFAGNGSLALDWEELTVADPDAGRAYLLVDYPGYGGSEGRASAEAMRRAADGALDALAARLGLRDAGEVQRKVPRLGVVGHSLGAAAALDFAIEHPAVSRVVLVAPFTSLRAMARRLAGWPLSWLLRENFDNAARLDALAGRSTPPRVRIFHGDTDTFIPSTMGQFLAETHPRIARFEPVPGAGHDDVVSLAIPRLLAALDEL